MSRCFHRPTILRRRGRRRHVSLIVKGTKHVHGVNYSHGYGYTKPLFFFFSQNLSRSKRYIHHCIPRSPSKATKINEKLPSIADYYSSLDSNRIFPAKDWFAPRLNNTASAHLLSGRVEDGRLIRRRGISTTSSFSRLTRRQPATEDGMTVLFAKTRPFFFVCIPRVPCT